MINLDRCSICDEVFRVGTAHVCSTVLKSPPGDAEVDKVNHPPHYTSHPSGVECIQITEHMGFNLGNALKYIWRADLKGSADEDLKKARWYIDREIKRRAEAQ